ncbi:MAG: SGNH hydrolase domain-containing protein [Chloroflexota bacterium]
MAVAASVLLSVSVGGAVLAATPSDSDRDGLADRFEIRYHLDPASRDSDHDGIRDSSEDADGDGLSALGEQMAGTAPRRADTDRDGLPDGQEDADGDGVDNQHEQDRRPLPKTLHPALGEARLDQPASWWDGCHVKPPDVDVRPCTYGKPDAGTTVVLFGDSHAAQWLPAFDRAGRAAGWRIVSITHSGCPAADLVAPDALVDVACGAWRQAALDWIQANPPELVVMVSGRMYQQRDAAGDPLPEDGAVAAWAAGSVRTVNHLAGLHVLDLGDTPHPKVSVPPCLVGHRVIAPCTTPRTRGALADWDAAEAGAVEGLGVRFRSPYALVCPYDPCPVVNGDILMWRDDHHLTATFSRALAPSIQAIVADALDTVGLAHARRPPRAHRGTTHHR